ncbi:hypothetical protein CRV01_01610 [Arcobacter sp. CECT 8983]|uniref:SHOCT domain-containing protein n=1 Tax=Arcobacter sp. CECT 8983 TaxID=2044508 RepID=UPI00100ACD5D|nr:SHOCT domain-containing protein [Arcobacter sp. CECT 8983]RXJ91814.1 hypothetical protein CRV01_01610 [Arcobacter sp. CECT 8983]
MLKFKKVLLVTLIVTSPIFAFDFGSKMDQLADNVSNSLFDKAVDGVNNSLEGNSKQPTQVNNTTTTSKSSKMQQLKELVEMKKQGYITNQEFNEQKKIILSQK